MEHTSLLNYFQGLVGFLVVIIGFLVRNLLSDIKTQLKDILVQVNLTNGRVGVLESEVRNDKLGLVSGTTNDFGEVLIGYRLNGIVRPDYVHCLGDYDFNGLIDLADLAGLLSTYAMTSDNPDFPYQVDFDASGVIDLADLAGLLADFGEACPA